MMKLLLSRSVGNDEASRTALQEAEKIYLSLQRLVPKLYDESGACRQTLESMGKVLEVTRLRVNGG